jgi:hypothetical protein
VHENQCLNFLTLIQIHLWNSSTEKYTLKNTLPFPQNDILWSAKKKPTCGTFDLNHLINDQRSCSWFNNNKPFVHQNSCLIFPKEFQINLWNPYTKNILQRILFHFHETTSFEAQTKTPPVVLFIWTVWSTINSPYLTIINPEIKICV